MQMTASISATATRNAWFAFDRHVTISATVSPMNNTTAGQTAYTNRHGVNGHTSRIIAYTIANTTNTGDRFAARHAPIAVKISAIRLATIRVRAPSAIAK